jgi:hypothetical protein
MNEKQWRFMVQRTEKALSDKSLEWKKAETLSIQYNNQYTQLEEYYQTYLAEQKNTENESQKAETLRNTHFFMRHLQGMLISQHSALQKCDLIKEKYRREWKKEQAKKRHLRKIKWMQWEEDEEEEEISYKPKKEL